MNKRLLTILALMVISVILTGRPSLLADEKSIGSRALGDILWAPSSPLTAQLEFTQVSESEGQITLTVNAADFFEAPDAHAEIVVPPGLAPAESTFTWEGDIAGGSEIRFSAPINVTDDGTWKIKGSVLVGDPNGEFLGDVDYLYLEVKDNAIVSEWEQPYYDGSSKPLEPIGDVPISVAVGSAAPIIGNNVSPQPASIDNIQMRPSPTAQVQEFQSSGDVSQGAPAGDLTVTGCFFYLDYLDSLLPLVWATVRIQDIDPTGPVDLGVDLTGLDGCFSFGPIENDDGPLEGRLDIRVQVLASSSVATVLDPSGNVYDGFSAVYENTPDGTLNIGNLAVPPSEQGAWTIFSYHSGLTKSWNYLQNEGPAFDVSPVVARYPFENWPHYHTGGFYGQEIHMPDLDSAKSPDTIAHEYAHHAMWFTYGGTFPNSFCPSPHYINRSSHVNCAWTEGFADFFPLAVFNDPVYTFPNRVNINFETPTRTSFNWHDGDDVEGRVAGALWDIYDPSPSEDDGYDVYGEGILNIWDTFERQNDNTFAEFWTEFQSNRSQSDISSALSALYQNTIDYLPPPPIFDLSATEPPQSVPVNQSFRMEFTMDVQGSGENGGVSISFPGLEATHIGPGPCYDSPQGSVSIVSYDTGIDQVTCYDQGDLVWNSAVTQVPAAHMLVESDDPAWPAGTSRKLVIDVTPKASGPFTINYRAWACSALHAGCARFPTPSNSEGSDQQGFDIISRTVNVLTPGSLTVTPPGGFGPQGIEGGPFSPNTKTFTLKNSGETPIDWATSKSQDWLNLSSTGGTLNSDQTTTVMVSVNENANSLGAGVHKDTLFFDNLTNGDGDTSRPVNLTIAAAADLAVTKSDSPDPALLGDELTYTIGIFNNGPSDATGVILTDQLPADVTFVVAPANCDELNLTVTCQIDNLSADAGMDIEIRVIAIAVGTMINTADVSSDVADPNMANNTISEITVVNPLADLAITKTDFRHWVLSGDQLTYTITVTNNGPSTATGLEITDDLPAGATFVSSNPAEPDCVIAGNQVKCGLDPLAPVSSTVVTITIVSNVLVGMTNMVSVASNVADPDMSNNTATDTTTVRLWPPGDANRDGSVDRHDLRMVVNNWGIPFDDRADLNEDGFAGIEDLSIAGMHFGI